MLNLRLHHFFQMKNSKIFLSSVEAETVKLALSNTTTGTPMEVEEPDDPDELPLSKRCHVSKVTEFCS